MIPGMIVVIVSIGAILLLLVAILAVSIRVFARLQTQQRQIEALEARADLLAGALADRRSASATPATPPVSPAPVPVPRAASPAAARSAPTAPSQTTALSPDGTPQSDARESLETRIGSRWLLYIGVAAIVIGAAYFEKLAFENRWVSETARVIQGGLAGLGLVYAGIWFRRAGYSAYGQMISGCGAAILYVST